MNAVSATPAVLLTAYLGDAVAFMIQNGMPFLFPIIFCALAGLDYVFKVLACVFYSISNGKFLSFKTDYILNGFSLGTGSLYILNWHIHCGVIIVKLGSNVNYSYIMNKILSLVLVLLVSSTAIGQTIGRVDKKTKEFFITSSPKAEYKIFGYQFPNISTRKMICFSTYSYDVRGNLNKCPLGSYFDTSFMKEGDRIIFLSMVGSFGKMNFITGSGKKTVFYIPKANFSIK